MNTAHLTVRGVLTEAADILAAQGWTQQGGYQCTPGMDPADCPLDLGSALAKAAGIDIHSHAATEPRGVHADAVLRLAAHILPGYQPTLLPVGQRLDALIDWQDEPGRTAAQVIAAVRGAAAAEAGEPGPFYPQPGGPIPDMPGYLVAECGHQVARSEWEAGFRSCERCPSQGGAQ